VRFNGNLYGGFIRCNVRRMLSDGFGVSSISELASKMKRSLDLRHILLGSSHIRSEAVETYTGKGLAI
jgi:hypothetical protein